MAIERGEARRRPVGMPGPTPMGRGGPGTAGPLRAQRRGSGELHRVVERGVVLRRVVERGCELRRVVHQSGELRRGVERCTLVVDHDCDWRAVTLERGPRGRAAGTTCVAERMKYFQ